MDDKFISSDRNDDFLNLNGMDLQELIFETENYFLDYRDNLNIPQDITFGVEIEYENLSKDKVDTFIDNKYDNWSSIHDFSCLSGGEIVSPVMNDEKKYWEQLKSICDYLKKNNADTLHNAGGHIHIGASSLGNNVSGWKTFLKLYAVYESVIFRFAYGDKISGRRTLLDYAAPIADYIKHNLNSINKCNDLLEMSNILRLGSRCLAVNFSNMHLSDPSKNEVGNTIEFRSPNSSTEAIIWQNNINTFTKMLVSSGGMVIDDKFLDYKLKYEYLSFSDNSFMYNIINLKNVLEFVDLVFDNNLDKVYFLRQYLKNFEETELFNKNKIPIKTKKFFK